MSDAKILRDAPACSSNSGCRADYLIDLIQFEPSRRGKKMLNYSRHKNEGTYRSGEGGGGRAMWPRIWVTTGREGEKSSVRIINGMKKEKKTCGWKKQARYGRQGSKASRPLVGIGPVYVTSSYCDYLALCFLFIWRVLAELVFLFSLSSLLSLSSSLHIHIYIFLFVWPFLFHFGYPWGLWRRWYPYGHCRRRYKNK